MRSGPSEQLSPMAESGFTCFTAVHIASTVWAEIIVSPPRPTAAEIDHRELRSWSAIEDFANGHQRRFGVERVEDGLHQEQVTSRP